MRKKVKVCFVGLYTYQLFNPDFKGIFGGSEVRASIIMKELAKDDNFEIVNVVNADPGVIEGEFDGVKVVKHSFYRHEYPGEGSQKLPLLKRLLPEKPGYYAYKLQLILTGIVGKVVERVSHSLFGRGIYGSGNEYIPEDKIAVYDAINADIYCIFGVKKEAYELFTYCENRQKKSILFIGSDNDLSEEYTSSNTNLNVYGSRNDLCFIAIQKANEIIAQTENQKNVLSERYGLDSIVIKNPIDLSVPSAKLQIELPKKFVLWVGKSSKVKAPDILLKLAKENPSIEFVMIMNHWDSSLHESIINNLTDNIKYIEKIPSNQIESVFSKAYLLISTSHFEGFPNAFLQAIKYSVPVLSLNADPDFMLSKGGCGFVANGNFELLSKELKRMMTMMDERDRIGEKAKSYATDNHRLEEITLSVKNVIRSLK